MLMKFQGCEMLMSNGKRVIGEITENGARGLVDGGAEVAPSVRGFGTDLEPVDGLLT